MPTYSYRCPWCNEVQDHRRTVDERDNAPTCHNRPMRRILTMPMLHIPQDIRYESPIDGRPIMSAQARREDLARSNCVPYDPDIKQDYQRRIKEGEEKLDKAVGETVDREIAKMPARKREKLEAEMAGGMSVEPTRTTASAQSIKREVQNG